MADAHIIVTTAAGVATAFLVTPRSTIRKDPFSGQTQVVTAGDASRRQDTRTPQEIVANQSGGSGEWAYDEVQELTSFTDSDCDTRSGMVVLPPARVALTGTVTGMGTPSWLVHYLGETNAEIVAFRALDSGSMVVYNPVTPAWVTPLVGGTAITNVSQFARYRGKYHVVGAVGGVSGVKSTADGVAWTSGAWNTALAGCCIHDNRFWSFNTVDGKLYRTEDPTGAAGVWTAGNAVLYLNLYESVQQLEEWRDPRGKPAVMVLTSHRLFWYDEDEDVFKLLDDWSVLALRAGAGTQPRMHVWQRDLNLYVVFVNPADQGLSMVAFVYSGTAGVAGPGIRGGTPANRRVGMLHQEGSRHWLYTFTKPRNGTSNPEKVFAMDDSQAFHTMWVGAGTGNTQTGGGFGPGRFYVALGTGVSGSVERVLVPDEQANPLVALGAAYDGNSTIHWHEYAWMDGGTENMPLTAVWVTIQARDMTNSARAGTPSTSRIYCQYQLQGDTGWTTLVGGVGYLQSSDTYPAVLPFNLGFGVKFREIKVRVGLWSSVTTSSPVVTSVALAYLRDEQPRYAYTVELDCSDMAHPLYLEKDRGQLAAALDGYAQPGTLVTLQFAGGDEVAQAATSVAIANCKVEYSAVLDPLQGLLAARVLFKDLTPPNSGA